MIYGRPRRRSTVTPSASSPSSGWRKLVRRTVSDSCDGRWTSAGHHRPTDGRSGSSHPYRRRSRGWTSSWTSRTQRGGIALLVSRFITEDIGHTGSRATGQEYENVRDSLDRKTILESCDQGVNRAFLTFSRCGSTIQLRSAFTFSTRGSLPDRRMILRDARRPGADQDRTLSTDRQRNSPFVAGHLPY